MFLYHLGSCVPKIRLKEAILGVAMFYKMNQPLVKFCDSLKFCKFVFSLFILKPIIEPTGYYYKIKQTNNVVSSLDRVNISVRRALFVVGTVAQALGHSVKDLSLSYSTIHRKRIVKR